MNEIAKFERVTREIFTEAMQNCFGEEIVNNKTLINRGFRYTDIPTRATKGSAGYDFHIPFDIELGSGESVVIPTCMRALIDPGWMLMIVPRSGLGFKYRACLANTIGIIDSDYSNSDNMGHIMIKLCNDGNSTIQLNEGDRIAQGIFVPYGIVKGDDAEKERNGGMGSTGME